MLNEEGFEIRERELMRVRAKNRWLLRMPNGMKSYSGSKQRTGNGSKRAMEGEENVEAEIENLIAVRELSWEVLDTMLMCGLGRECCKWKQ